MYFKVNIKILFYYLNLHYYVKCAIIFFVYNMAFEKNIFRRHSPPSNYRRKIMQKVDLFVEFMDDVELVYAVFCVGVMDDKFIYAKRTSDTGHDDPTYIQVSITDTKDCTSNWQGIKSNFVARNIEVSSNDGLYDSRINTNPSFSQELMVKILSAVQESLE